MGGSWQQKKTIVEDCVALDVNMLVRKRTIAADNIAKGTMSWTTSAGIAYQMEFECDRGRALRLRYQSGSQTHDYERCPRGRIGVYAMTGLTTAVCEVVAMTACEPRRTWWQIELADAPVADNRLLPREIVIGLGTEEPIMFAAKGLCRCLYQWNVRERGNCRLSIPRSQAHRRELASHARRRHSHRGPAPRSQGSAHGGALSASQSGVLSRGSSQAR